MRIDTPLRFGIGFPSEKSRNLVDLCAQLNKYFSCRQYGDVLDLMCVWFAIYKPEHIKKIASKPRIKKSITYKRADGAGWPKDWLDQHVPEHLELQTYVDFDTAAQATGSALRHALVDPICATLLLTPKTIQQRIRIQDLIADLKIWAELDD